MYGLKPVPLKDGALCFASFRLRKPDAQDSSPGLAVRLSSSLEQVATLSQRLKSVP